MEKLKINSFLCSQGHTTECDVPIDIAEVLHLPCCECDEWVKLIPDPEPKDQQEADRQEFVNMFIPVLIEQSFALADSNYWRGFICGVIAAVFLCVVGTITLLMIY